MVYNQHDKESDSNAKELLFTILVKSDWHELLGASLCNHNLTMTMLKTVMMARGKNDEGFPCPLHGTKIELNSALLSI